MPFTVCFNGHLITFEKQPTGLTPADVKEMIVGAFDHDVNDGTFSLRSRDGHAPSAFHADLEGNWELILIPCECAG